MGLMGGSNPYFVENPIAAALNGLRSGGMDGYKSALDKRKMDADIANQKDTRAQQQQLIDIQVQAAQQKQAEQAMFQKAQSDLQARIAPRQLVDDSGIPTELGEGLLPPEFKEQFKGPYADPSQAVQQVGNPAWGETLGALQQQKTLPALPLSAMEAVGFTAQNPSLAPAIKEYVAMSKDPKMAVWQKVLDNPKEYSPESVALAGKFLGVDGIQGAGPKSEYKSREYEKGDRKYFEESQDGGRTWKSVSNAPRYKPQDGRNRSGHTEFKDVMALRKEFSSLPEVKDYATIQAQGMRAKKALQESLNNRSNMPVDQTVITTFNKLLDPSSVVRESEYARTPQDMAVLSRIKGKWNKVVQGGAGLDLGERQALVRMIGNFSEIADTQYQDQVEQYTELAKRNGFSPSDVIRLGHKQKPAAQPSPGTPKVGEMRGGYMFMGGNPADKKSWGKR